MSNDQDLYLRRTRGTETVVTYHRVWDVDRFLSSQIEQYSGSKVKAEDRYVVSMATKADFKS